MIKIKENTYSYKTGNVEPTLYDVETWWRGNFNKENNCIEEKIDSLVQNFATLLSVMMERGDMDKDTFKKFVAGYSDVEMVKVED
jgi:hypothetical protein